MLAHAGRPVLRQIKNPLGGDSYTDTGWTFVLVESQTPDMALKLVSA